MSVAVIVRLGRVYPLTAALADIRARPVGWEEFWAESRAGATVPAASRSVGVSHWTGYRWLAEVGGRPRWGWNAGGVVPGVAGPVRRSGTCFWAELRRGATVPVAGRAAGVSKDTGYAG